MTGVASFAQWVEGARPRTLPNAVAPVIAGTGAAAWLGDAGLGEVAVFVFFGLVAVLGTQYTQTLRVDWVGAALAVATGALSSAVLVANNLRDIPTDTESGKITLAFPAGFAT